MAYWEQEYDEVSEEVISQVEKKLGIKFPLDYILHVTKYHGSTPEPSDFRFEQCAGSLDKLLSFNEDEYESMQRLAVDMMRNEFIPDKVIPFAIDAAGNFICFDYRSNENRPSIVFVFHEEENAISPVCQTFTELIDNLHEDE